MASRPCLCDKGKKLPLPPYPVLLFLFQICPITIWNIDRFIARSTSDSRLYPVDGCWYIFLYFLLSVAYIGMIQTIHLLIHYALCFLPLLKGKKAIMPSIIPSVFFSFMAILNFVYEIYDVESRREYQGVVSFELLDAYVFHPSIKYADLNYSVTGVNNSDAVGVSANMEQITSAMKESPGHWVYILLLLFCTVTVGTLLVAVYRYAIAMSLLPFTTRDYKEVMLEDIKEEEEENHTREGVKGNVTLDTVITLSDDGKGEENAAFLGKKKNKSRVTIAVNRCTQKHLKELPQNPIVTRAKGESIKELSIAYWTYPPTLVILGFALVCIVSMPMYMASDDYIPLYSGSPAGYLMTRNFFQNYLKIPEAEFVDASNEVREQMQPYLDLEGRVFLDTRDPPLFPLVHGEFEDLCRLSPEDGRCSSASAENITKLRRLPKSINYGRDSVIPNGTQLSGGEYELKEHNKEETASNNDGASNTTTGQTLQDDQSPETEYDIVLLIVESFSPSNANVDEEMREVFQQDPSKVIYKFDKSGGGSGPTGYYDREILPNLHDLSGSGSFTVFPGLSSMSLPTINGWFSLVSGTGSFGSTGMVDGRYLHMSDIFSTTKAMGFDVMYLSPSPLDFDGKHGVFYRMPLDKEAIAKVLENIRGSKKRYQALKDNGWKFTDDQWEDVKKVHKKLMKDPVYEHLQVVDAVMYSVPSQEYMDDVKRYLDEKYPIDADYHVPDNNSSWVCDRITSLEFIYYFLHFEEGDLMGDVERVIKAEQGESERPRKGPIFAAYANVDTHTPFMGFDDGQTDKVDKEAPVDVRYSTTLHSSDKYLIGRTVDFLKTRERDTVLFVVGDHGARVVDLKSATNEHCRTKDLGGEQFYTTSAMIGYIQGTKPGERKNQFLSKYGDILGTVYNVPVDHMDFLSTLLTVASLDVDSNGTRLYVPPNAITGRNLFEMIKAEEDSMNNLHGSPFLSYSMVSLQKEIRYYGDTNIVLRGHAFSHGDYIILNTGGEGANGALIYPSCMDEGGELTEEMKNVALDVTDSYERRKRFIHNIYTFDKVYSSKFVTSDELPGEFPKVDLTPAAWEVGFAVVLLWVILVLVMYCVTACCLGCKFGLCKRAQH